MAGGAIDQLVEEEEPYLRVKCMCVYALLLVMSFTVKRLLPL
jgi:hypothetical protein